MTRAFARSLAVVALVSTLVAVPSVGAGPRFVPPSQNSADGWLTSAWAWMGSALGLNASSRVSETPSQAIDSPGLVRVSGHTGVCIDPLGNPYPCSQWLLRPPVLSSPGIPRL